MDKQHRAQLAEVNDQISAAKGKAQDAWSVFEGARDKLSAAQTAGNVSAEVLSAAEAAHDTYKEASAQLGRLESSRNLVFGEIADDDAPAASAATGIKAGEPGSWLAAAIQDVKESRSMATGGAR
jgi:hypothetical protein